MKSQEFRFVVTAYVLEEGQPWKEAGFQAETRGDTPNECRDNLRLSMQVFPDSHYDEETGKVVQV